MPYLFSPPTAQIRIATPADNLFVRSLQKDFAAEVGFIPDQAREWYLAAGCINIALQNGAPAGYLLGREKLRWNIAIRPIFQAAIDFDAQRRHLGLSLVAQRETEAREAGQMALQACCRDGIDANTFWEIAGFTKICQLDPKASRKRLINVWRKPLSDYIPPWFHLPPPIAGYKAKRTLQAK